MTDRTATIVPCPVAASDASGVMRGDGAGVRVTKPAESAFDDPAPLSLTELEPGLDAGDITLSAIDADGVAWAASMRLDVDNRGRAATDLAPLISAMAPADATVQGARVALDSRGGLDVLVTVGKDPVIAAPRIRRSTLPHEVHAEQVSHGTDLRGMLYTPRHCTPRAAVLLLAGSGGGIDHVAGQLLARRGFLVFAQALFAWDDLPPHMVDLPIERIGRGLSWLADRSGGLPIAVRGISKGSEGAAHAALEWPDLVQGLILWVPSPMATTGRGAAPGPRALFTRNDTPIPYGIPPFPAGFGATQGSPAAPIALAPIFQRMWSDPANDRYRFAVERLTCPLLLVSADDDQIWPSAFAARQIAQRAERARVIHVQNPDAGHAINAPGLPMGDAHLAFHPRQQTWLAMGGTPDGNAAGARASWDALLAFLADLSGGAR